MEGEFEDLEMKKTEEYPEYDDMSYDDLLTEFDRLDDENINLDDDSDISRRFDYVENLLIDRERLKKRQRETSFTDNDDGKTVTIKKGKYDSGVTVPAVEFVDAGAQVHSQTSDIPSPPKGGRVPRVSQESSLAPRELRNSSVGHSR